MFLLTNFNCAIYKFDNATIMGLYSSYESFHISK